MRSILAAAYLAVTASACATTTQSLAGFEEPNESVRVLVMDPEVEMKFMTTSGSELRVDWTEAAKENLLREVAENLQSTADTMIEFTMNSEAEDELTQLMLLNEAVTSSIIQHRGLAGSNVLPVALPNRQGTPFEYTMGEDMKNLGNMYDADYALFMASRAQFESSGVVFRNLLIATATAAATMGTYAAMPASQSYKGTYMSLVDLDTGNIVWVNGYAGGNPRDPEAAERIVDAILKTSPLAGAQ